MSAPAGGRVTYYVALPFSRTEEGDIVSGEAKDFQQASAAVRAASFMAADPKLCGAIAFSRTGDPALGDFDDAVIIKSFGEVDAGAMGG